MTKAKTTSYPISNQRQLAKLLGISPQSFNRNWMKHPDWPFGRGPWRDDQIPTIRRWAVATLSTNPADETSMGQKNDVQSMSPTARAKLGLLHEKIALMRIERAGLLHEFHRTDECQARRLRQIRTVTETLCRQAPQMLAEELFNKSADQFVPIIERFMEQLCTRFAKGSES